MRQPYRNLFGSCLLAALILPSQPSSAAPTQENSAAVRVGLTVSGISNANPTPAGIRSEGTSPGNPADGLAQDVTVSNMVSSGREPILGRPPTPEVAGQTAPISLAPGAGGPIKAAPALNTQPAVRAALMVSAALAAPVSDNPPQSATPTFNQSPTSPSAPPASSFSAPRPAMPAALTEAMKALSEKKMDDAVRLARTFISQTEAKGPGPESTPPTMALAYEIVGTALAVQGKLDEAIVEFKKALTFNPSQATALFKLGVIYRDQGKLADAKSYLEKAVATGGGDPMKLFLADINERLGDIPAALAIYEPMLSTTRGDDLKFKIHVASLYDRTDRYGDAIKLLQPVVTADSKDADGLVVLGFAYGGANKPKDAIPLLLAAKTLTPDNWRVDLALGTAQREIGDIDAAEITLKRAVAAEPKQVQALFQLALIQMAKSQFQNAIGNLTEAEKLAPKAPEIQQVLGDALFRLGKKDDALAEFKQLATRDGATLNDSVNLARVYQAVDRPDDAIQVYREAMQKFPPNPGISALLATVQAQQKKFDEARATIAEARKTTPDDVRLLRTLIQIETAAGQPRVALSLAQHLVDIQPKSLEDRYNLATIYTRVGDNKRAISTYRALLTEMPDNPVTLNNLASVLTDDGNAKEALPLARKALAAAPTNAAINDTVGWALVKLGQSKEALPLLELAIKTEPANPELHYHLGMAQKAQNNPKAARTSLEKALSLSPDFTGAADAKTALASLPK